MPTKFTVLAAAVAALSLSLVGCASTPAASTSASAPAGTTTVTVFAAASMKTTFTTLGKTFEAYNDDEVATPLEAQFAGLRADAPA